MSIWVLTFFRKFIFLGNILDFGVAIIRTCKDKDSLSHNWKIIFIHRSPLESVKHFSVCFVRLLCYISF
jgi:hypothetical protein